jgi:hypothetical protein
MATLAEIRAKLKAAETKSADGNRTGGDNSIYAFWNLKEGEESTMRFLPDGNADNTFFWVERAMIKLPFAGIKGDSDSRSTIVQVPCVEMYGDACPILADVRGWFKDPSMEAMGRQYWKKRSYIFQGFVPEDGLKEKETPANPIRRFIIGPQIFTSIRAALVDPELEDLPTDYVHGLDFRMKKGTKGGYADYSTSSWARRERPLGDAEQAAIKEHGLFNLNDFLPKRPGDVELKVMKEMFEASVDGEPYDAERWGSYFKPAGMAQQTGDPTKGSSSAAKAPAPAPRVAPVPTYAEEAAAPQAPAQRPPEMLSSAAPAGDSRAQDILTMIRNRSK